MQDGTRPKIVGFGTFRLDLTAGELCVDGHRIRLQEQPFQLLKMLVERPGEVVTRDEIRAQLWPAGTVVEFDRSINAAVKKLRIALKDSAEEPRYVETMARRGYRFVAAVQRLDGTPELRRPRRRLVWLTAAISIVSMGLVLWILNTRTKTGETELTPVPLTSYPGGEWHPSFSPDGNEVAFAWRRPEQDHSDIYVKLVGASEPTRLTNGPADNYGPAWAPDGRSIAFLRKLSDARSGVFLISPIGGPERKLGELHLGAYGSAVDWHPSGKWLIVTDRSSAEESPGLFSLALENGEKRRLTSPPPNTFGDQEGVVSPGGEALVFVRNSSENRWDLYLVALSDGFTLKGEPRLITLESTFSYTPAWMPDGRTIVFSSGSPHAPTLYRMSFSRPGWRAGKPQRLVFAGVGARDPVVSKQGRLAYSTSTIDANIWRLELNNGYQAVKPPEKVIASTHLDHTPQYSPDGRRIAFASNRSGSHEIWMSNSDGSGIVQLTFFRGSGYTANPHWSADGRQIYFGSTAEGQYAAYVISSEGGQPKRLGSETPESWSRDGKWVYFHHGGEIWKRSAAGGSRIQITRRGGHQELESPDGRLLYYLKEDEEFTSLWKVPVEGGQEVQILPSVCCQNFAVADQGIYFVPDGRPEGHSSVHFLSFATGKVTRVAALADWAAYGLSVSPDGRWLLYSQYEPKGSDLWMVENFR